MLYRCVDWFVASCYDDQPSYRASFRDSSFFVLAYIVTLVIFTAAIIIAFRVLQTANIIHKKQPELQLRRAYMYASVIALAPVILVAMQSVGALGIWDVSLVIIFEILACFYIWRRS